MQTKQVKIIKGRESGSIGTAHRENEQDMWFVILDRTEAPFRGHYEDDEVEIISNKSSGAGE